MRQSAGTKRREQGVDVGAVIHYHPLGNVDSSEDDSGDDLTLISVAAPLPATDMSSTSSTDSQPVSTSTDEADAVDEAISDFDAGPLDDALLEDLAVSLVG